MEKESERRNKKCQSRFGRHVRLSVIEYSQNNNISRVENKIY